MKGAHRLWPLLLALSACGDPSPQPRPEASAPPSASAATPSSASAAAPPSATASANAAKLYTLHPPGPSASREERERAAVDILSGRARAADLPLAAVDPGEAFEPHLRAAMSMPMDIRVASVTPTGVDEQAVRAAVEKSKMRFRLCYAAGLRLNPNLQGRVRGRVGLQAAGRPLDVENMGSDVPDGSVVQCVIDALRKVDYPAPQGPAGGVVVELAFSPG